MKTQKPITAERIEAALDRLAEIMIDLGPEGAACLPIYERLERELELAKSVENKMASVMERARRSKSGRASPPLS